MEGCLAVLLLLASLAVSLAHEGHHDEAVGTCKAEDGVRPRVAAPYAPGIITLDGNDADWADVPGEVYSLKSALESTAYPLGDGSITIKAAHDGRDIYFLLRAPGPFVFDASSNQKNPAMALMFQIGVQATFDSMGGCLVPRGECNEQTCPGRQVDIMQFQIRTTVPGRLYGANPVDNGVFSGQDRFGNLKDMYGYSPHCLDADGPVATNGFNSSSPDWGAGGSQNDWQGTWSHTSLPHPGSFGGLTLAAQPFGQAGVDGDVIMEFRRPLRTFDRLQQDVQLQIGGTYKFGPAFWYPLNGQPWKHEDHYVAHCDWIDLDILPRGEGFGDEGSIGTVLGSFALVFSLGAVAASAYLFYQVRMKSSGFVQVSDL